jgi:DNA-binding response OmpR family regulator
MDVMMPELDGPSTLAKMREDKTLAMVPVVFISAKVQKKEVADYLKMGALGVINKPFDPLTLGKDVDAIWNQDNLGDQQ